MTQERRRRAAGPLLTAILCLVMVNAGFAVLAIHGLVRSASWLSHTWQVIGQTQRIMASAVDAETGVRGYVITGDAAYLQHYLVARSMVFHQIDDFASLTSDNQIQMLHASRLRGQIQQRFEQLQGGIDTRRDQGFEAARMRVLTGEGLAQMSAIRYTVADIEREELHLLAQRQVAQQHSSELAYIATAVAAGLDLVFIVLTFRYLARERVLRFASEDAAAQLRLANDKIARASADLQQLNTELEERVRARTADLESTNRELEAFSYSVSHDLRAPLRTIDGFSLALEEDYVDLIDATGRDYISRVRAGVQRMGGLIDALLQLSRITRAEIHRSSVNVTAMIEDVAASLRDEHPSQVLHFNVEDGMLAEADPGLLRVAFENLMGNAVKFSGRKPETFVDVAFDAEKKAFLIRDQGAGFDMQYGDKLFHAFHRLHGDKDFKGSGIGLATVARVVGRHHGTIWAESEVNHGATFWFTLG